MVFSKLREAQVINAASVFVEGIGFLGVSKEVELPAIEFETYTQNAGFYKANQNSGILKEMTLKVKFSEYNIVYLNSMSSQFNGSSNLYVKWNVSSQKGHFGHVATFRGNITKLTMPKIASGEEVEVELEMQVYFYKKDENNAQVMLIDTRNMICLMGGKDIWADLRSHVM